MVPGIGYSHSEVEKLLEIIEDEPPYSGDDWERVQQRLAEVGRSANGKIENKPPVDSLSISFLRTVKPGL